MKNNYKKGISFISILLIVAFIAVGSLYVISKNKTTSPKIVVCTKDAKLCSDGSSVGRTGPNCEFVCPEVKNPKNNFTFLRELIKSNGIIKECNLNGEKIYSSDTSPMDGSLDYFYNNNLKPFLSCGHGLLVNPPPDPARCSTINQELKDCKIIYSTLSEIKIDIYNLSNN